MRSICKRMQAMIEQKKQFDRKRSKYFREAYRLPILSLPYCSGASFQSIFHFREIFSVSQSFMVTFLGYIAPYLCQNQIILPNLCICSSCIWEYQTHVKRKKMQSHFIAEQIQSQHLIPSFFWQTVLRKRGTITEVQVITPNKCITHQSNKHFYIKTYTAKYQCFLFMT